MSNLSRMEIEAIQKQILTQFHRLVSDINSMNASAWAEHYSREGFLSAVAGTDHFAARGAWVDTVTSNFSARERQHLEVIAVQVTALAPDLALLTSQGKSEMVLSSGEANNASHVFTMVWKKENDAWKILHSHESWLDASME